MFSTSFAGVTNASAPEFDDFPLYPFDNQVFNEAFESVAVSTRSSPSFDTVLPPLLEFGGHSIFTSTRRRHTEKAVPPKHLSGDDGKPEDKRTRQRVLRNNQRFMRNPKSEAKSLSGAKGALLEQEVITAVGQGGQGGAASGRSTRPNTHPTHRLVHVRILHNDNSWRVPRAKRQRSRSRARQINRAHGLPCKDDQGGLGERGLVGCGAQGS